MGGTLNGGKIRGLYPYDFIESPTNPLALSRGRMIPNFPWDSMLYGTVKWFGVNVDSDEIDKVLPMHKNFDMDKLYSKLELYNLGAVVTVPAGDSSPGRIVEDGSFPSGILAEEGNVSAEDFTDSDLAEIGDTPEKLLGVPAAPASAQKTSFFK